MAIENPSLKITNDTRAVKIERTEKGIVVEITAENEVCYGFLASLGLEDEEINTIMGNS